MVLPLYINNMLTPELLESQGYPADFIEIIDDYFTIGTTGMKQPFDVDAVLDAYISAGRADKHLKDLLFQYRIDPEFVVNDAIRTMLENYHTDSDTGNDALNARLNKCAGEMKDYITEKAPRWLINYLSSGKTNSGKAADTAIEQYLTTGATESTTTEALDAVVASQNKDVDYCLSYWLRAYWKDKMSVTIVPVRTMLTNYHTPEGTGSKALDGRLRILSDQVADQMLQDAMNNANQGGGGGGGQQEPQDTRVYFLVVLNYTEELRQAELNRKGLDYSAKVEELEVD